MSSLNVHHLKVEQTIWRLTLSGKTGQACIVMRGFEPWAPGRRCYGAHWSGARVAHAPCMRC